MQEDDTRGDGFLRSESLLVRLEIDVTIDGSATVSVLVSSRDASTDPTLSRAAHLKLHRPCRRHDQCLWQGNIDANELLETPASSPTSPNVSAPSTTSRPSSNARSTSATPRESPVLRRELVEPERVSRHRLDADAENASAPSTAPSGSNRRDENRALREVRRIYRGVSPRSPPPGTYPQTPPLGAPLHLLVSPSSTVRDPRG